MTESTPAAYAATIDGRLYGYGTTKAEARKDAAYQFAGSGNSYRTRMVNRLEILPLDAEEASATAECLDAVWII